MSDGGAAVAWYRLKVVHGFLPILEMFYSRLVTRLLKEDDYSLESKNGLFRTKFGKSNEYSTKPNTVYWYTGYDSHKILPPLVESKCCF